MIRFHSILSVDTKSIYKSIWIFSRICITWSLFPDTLELTSFSIGYYPDSETPKLRWSWDRWFA